MACSYGLALDLLEAAEGALRRSGLHRSAQDFQMLRIGFLSSRQQAGLLQAAEPQAAGPQAAGPHGECPADGTLTAAANRPAPTERRGESKAPRRYGRRQRSPVATVTPAQPRPALVVPNLAPQPNRGPRRIPGLSRKLG